jgi:hypothetical protein
LQLINEFETDSVARIFARLHSHVRHLWRTILSSFDRNNDGRIDLLDLADFRQTLRASLQSFGGFFLNILANLEARALTLARLALGAAAYADTAWGCASVLLPPRDLHAPAASSLERGLLRTAAAETSLASARAAYLRGAARRRACAVMPACFGRCLAGGVRDGADRLLARLDGVGAHLAAADGPLAAAAAELRAAAARRARRAALWCGVAGLHAAAALRAASPAAAAPPLASLAASALAAALSLRRRAALRRRIEEAATAQRRHDTALVELARLAAAASAEEEEAGCLG